MKKELIDVLTDAKMFATKASDTMDYDLHEVAKWLLAYRVAARRCANIIDKALAEGSSSKTDATLMRLAIENIEEICFKAEMIAQNDITNSIDLLVTAMEMVQQNVSEETHSINDPGVRKRVLGLTDGRCAYCAIELVESGGESNQFCIEHVVPVSSGGPNHVNNYVPSCRSCNNSKGDRHVLYFIQNSHVLRQRVQTATVIPIKTAEGA